jgi:hypothetical protein
MKHNLILISALFILYSCGSEENKQLSKSFDSLKTALETSDLPGTTGYSENKREDFDNLPSEFSKRYSISSDWYKLNKNNRNSLMKELQGKFILIPVTKSQVSGIINTGFSDTSIVFTGNSSNAFVFDIDSSPSSLEKISSGKSCIFLLKIKKISDSMKLYLAKKGMNFQYSELRVTEFMVLCDLIDAASTTVSDSILLKKFNLKEF